jgi:DNA-binding NtrC family response regulator
VELAEGGTLFLDEIGELSLPTQAKLLRLLQEKTFCPLGGTRVRSADVRFVAATHRDLEAMLGSGQFRAELYYRLNVVPIRVAPLRERSGDIRPLTEHFCDALARLNGQTPPRFAQPAWSVMERYAWPGNVRELQNLCERLVVLRAGEILSAEVLATELGVPTGSPRTDTPAVCNGPPVSLELDKRLRDTERDAIVTAIAKARGNRALAARILRISRRSLYNKLAEHGLDVPDEESGRH